MVFVIKSFEVISLYCFSRYTHQSVYHVYIYTDVQLETQFSRIPCRLRSNNLFKHTIKNANPRVGSMTFLYFLSIFVNHIMKLLFYNKKKISNRQEKAHSSDQAAVRIKQMSNGNSEAWSEIRAVCGWTRRAIKQMKGIKP